jgi:glycosyltransferase involved in cell wall biosynthesis
MAQGYPIAGGIEAHIYHYACELRNHGFRTKVVVPNGLPKEEHRFMRMLREQGIPLESVSDKNRVVIRCAALAGYAPWRLRHRGKADWNVARFTAYTGERLLPTLLKRKLRQDRPAIIHVFGRVGDNVWPALPPERTVLHHMTVGKLDESWMPAEIEHFRAFAEKAARYFAPGSGVAENIHREFGIQRPIETIYTMAPEERDNGQRTADNGPRTTDHGREEGGDLRTSVPQSDVYNLRSRASDCHPPPATRHADPFSLRFGILCRMTDEKGIRYIFEALLAFRERHGDVRFLFAGTGYLADAIKGFIKDNGLANVRYEETFASPAAVMGQIDVFVHPSVTDAMPMAIVEALMCGKPCIGTRVGGIADLVRDGEEGRIIEPHRADQILSAMEYFAATDSEELARYARRARARYEEVCRPDSVGRIVAEHYREMERGPQSGDHRP